MAGKTEKLTKSLAGADVSKPQQTTTKSLNENPRTVAVSEKMEKLIKSLAGANCKTGEKRRFEQFASQKIHNHRYLTTNSHEINRTVMNMTDRFSYEGMPDFANALRCFTTEIINNDDWKDHYEVDVQYSVLDFLFSVTHEPMQNVRRNRVEMSKQLAFVIATLNAFREERSNPELETNSSASDIGYWAAVLSEFNLKEPSDHGDSESSSLSDWSEEIEKDDCSQSTTDTEPMTTLHQHDMALIYANSRDYPSGSNTFVPSEASNSNTNFRTKNFEITKPKSLTLCAKTNNTSWCKLPKLPALQKPKQQTQYTQHQQDDNYMLRRVHSHWWRQDINIYTMMPTVSPISNFAIASVQFLNRRLGSEVMRPIPRTITEICLLREIIFMFFAPVSCCFFEVHQEHRRIIVRENVSICSVSADTLKRIIEVEILPVLEWMMDLRQLVKQLTLPMINYSSNTGTLECFGMGVRDLLQPIYERLIGFERLLLDKIASEINEELNLSLIGFVRHMRDDFEQLRLLHLLCANVILPKSVTSPHFRSIYLLSQLYKQTRHNEPQQKMATALLLVSLRRYCNIMDNWWRLASFEDCHNEYIVESQACAHMTTGQTLIKRQLSEDEPNQLQLRNCEFYQLLMEHALDAGETQELLADVDLLGDVITNSKSLGNLFNDLVQKVSQELTRYCAPDLPQAVVLYPNNPMAQYGTQMVRQVESLGNQELMRIFSQHLIQQQPQQPAQQEQPQQPSQQQQPQQPSQQQQQAQPLSVVQLVERMQRCTLQLQPRLVARALEQVLRQRCQLANFYVISWYREQLQISDNVRFLRHFMLLEADFLLYPFYTSLFRLIDSGQEWVNSSLLTLKLYDLLDPHYDMAGKIHVRIISQLGSCSNKVVEALDAIELVYDMPPPLQRIITPEHMLKYNAIWRLMLKVKWAAWKLENLQFLRRKSTMDIYAPLDLLGLTVRRLEMVRFWLLYVINNIHSHLCTHVIQSMGIQFEQQLEKVSNIRELYQLHNEYMKRLVKHCLLSDDFHGFRLALDQLFHLVYVLTIEWNTCSSYIHKSHALSLDTSMDYNPFDADGSDPYSDDSSESNQNKVIEYLAINQVVEIERTYIRCHHVLADILTYLVYKHDHKFINSLEVAFNSSMPC